MAAAQPKDQPTLRHGKFTQLKEAILQLKKRSVYRGFDMENGVEVLWHTIDIEQLSPTRRLELTEQFTQIKQLAHAHIVRVLEFWVDDEDTKLHFITELMSSGSLNEFLVRPGKLGRKTFKRWCRQILSALAYLHSQSPPIIHTAITCHNLYFNGSSGQVKIACWDIALNRRDITAPTDRALDYTEYMAPEMFEDEKPTELVDVYGFGLCVLQLVTKKRPYAECKSKKMLYDYVHSGVLPEALQEVSDGDIKAMVMRCLAHKAHRPSAKELLQDPFVRDSNQKQSPASAVQGPGTPPAGEDRVVLSHRVIGTALLTLEIHQGGRVREIHFPFNAKEHQVPQVAENVCRAFELPPSYNPLVQQAIAQYVKAFTA